MGQYYTPIISNAREGERFADHITAWAYSHDFRNGLKLMEHSYVGNDFTETIVAALQKQSARLVWAGDYADNEVTGALNLYGIADQVHLAPFQIQPPAVKPTEYDYLLNSSKREYVDMRGLPQVSWTENDLQIHPLPLLCAEGNGRGGGDYNGPGFEFVGRWARDFISVRLDGTPPEGWVEIRPNFTE